MAHMKRCLAQLSLSGPWGSEHLWPGLEVDVDRELVPARAAVAAKGDEGTDGYIAAVEAAPAFTVRDAIAGREDCFEDVSMTADAGPAPVGFTHTTVPDGTDFSNATIRSISDGAAPTQQE